MLRIPDFRLPAAVAVLGQKLPQWPHSVNLCVALSTACKFGWLPSESLSELEGRTFAVIVEDTGGEANFVYENGLFRPIFRITAPADVCFRGTVSGFLKLILRQEDPDTLFFNRVISIEGDTELGLLVKNLLDSVEWPPAAFSRFLPAFALQR